MRRRYWIKFNKILDRKTASKSSKMMKFIRFGVEYYISARLSYLNGLYVSGYLFHLAFEKILKSILLSKYSEEDLKSERFKHKLKNIWDECKLILDQKTLDRFDNSIARLDKQREIKYPLDDSKIDVIKKIKLHGRMVEVVGYIRSLSDTAGNKTKKYDYPVVLNEMDELFSTILDALDADPAYLKGLAGKSGVGVYRKNNKYKFF